MHRTPPAAPTPTTRRSLLRALDRTTETPPPTDVLAALMPVAQRPLTPEAAFDALYIYAAPGLVHQAHLLTGCRRRAFESAEHAFRHAWAHWPEVARDPDPVGWVRARSHEYALSPWHRFRRLRSRPGPAPADPLLRALLDLPPRHRRTALLVDGLGLTVSEAAAETESSTYAVRGRLRHARAVLGATPGAAREALRARLDEASAATLAHPRSVRAGGERRARAVTRTVCAATAALVALVTFTVATTPARHDPGHGPRGGVSEGRLVTPFPAEGRATQGPPVQG
ncbi:sigma-70 family RNA polymerase sigma factor [Streptomyces sp. enrichment culture]|uniref:sigma-70 family RNA polymerase sigma factor n=1 Tax=Streptomyces sp. enrichment culture TaxID=1795815 RepID=UPI003F563728